MDNKPSTNEQPGDAKNLSREIKKAERWMIWLSAAIVLLTAGLVYVGHGQLCTMQGQLLEMKNAGEQTKEIINTANRQGDALVASNRPWIGIAGDFAITKMQFIPNPTRPNDLNPISLVMEISYVLENSGGSPARRVAGGLAPIVNGLPQPSDWRNKAQCLLGEQISKGNTVPAVFILPKSRLKTGTLSNTGIDKNVREIKDIWLTACFVYQDTLGGPIHHTKLLYRPRHDPKAIPITVMKNPLLTYVPISGFEMWDSDTD